MQKLDEEAANAGWAKIKEKSGPSLVKRQTRVSWRPRIYVVMFVLKKDRDVRFLKIGISRYAIEARFGADLRHYDVYLLAQSCRHLEVDALTIEGALHREFAEEKFRPEIPLCSGNTECFRFRNETLLRMAQLIF